jgi:chloramphenicol 3-O phosphotransferase
MQGKLIIVNGPSSAGKSTLANAFHDLLDEPFLRISIDHLREGNVLPLRRIRSGEFAWERMRPAFFDGFHRCLPAFASAGNNLLVEHIIETVRWMSDLVDLLASFDVFFVGLHCQLPELERRERARGDRRIGEARTDFETVHRHAVYDFELDSTNPLGQNVETLLSAWRARSRPSAFDKMSRSYVR